MTEHVPGRVEGQEFHGELRAIDAKVIELLTMVAEDLPRATDALLNGDSETVRTLAERDRAIDGLYPEIEKLADRELLLQQPAASDFRLLVSVLRVVPELERSHDLIVNIARRGSLILSQDLSARSRSLIEHMGKLASEMWREAVDCWCERDSSAAVALGERDDEMDDLYAALMAELASGEMTLPVTMQLTLVARFYERLADHAVNIARRVIYLAGQRINAPAELRPSSRLWSYRGPVSLGRDAGGEGFHLVLPAFFQRSLDIGHLDLALGDPDQSLALQDLVHDRAGARPPGELLFAGHAPGPVWMRSRLGGQNGVLRARGQLHLLQEPAHAADRLAEARGRAEQVQISRRQLFRPGLPDVMDLDRDALGGHLLAELFRNHGPVAVLGGVQILDLHRDSSARFQFRFFCP
jgi:phosphate transport system protein